MVVQEQQHYYYAMGRRKMLKRMKVYVGPDHPHDAQVSGQTEA